MNNYKLGTFLLSLALSVGCKSERPEFGDPGEQGGETSGAGGEESNKATDAGRIKGAMSGDGGKASEPEMPSQNEGGSAGEPPVLPGPSCDTGLTRCGDTCVNTLQEGAHCGGCDKPCAEGRVCQDGSCELGCADNVTLCGSSCVETASNPQHCGDCDAPCSEPSSGGKAVCAASQCAIECDGTLTECEGDCVDTSTDNKHCGGCGVPCSGECIDGTCCPSDRENCDGACVDLNSSAAHCGQCGEPCASGQVCENGECATDCQSGDRCGDDCVDLSTDLSHCRSCDNDCSPPAANGKAECGSSGCEIACNAGHVECGATCCNKPPANAQAVCEQNSCKTSCNSGYHACNGNPSVCYADDDIKHCGASGTDCKDCTQLYAESACVSGACANTCKDGIDLGCDSAPGMPTCGRWDFESNTTEGWEIDKALSGGADYNASTGVFEADDVHFTTGTRSLSVGFKDHGNSTDQNVYLKVQLCPSGKPVNLVGRTLMMDIYPATAPGRNAFRSAEDNGTAHFYQAFNDSEVVFGGCDFKTDPDRSNRTEASCAQFPSAVTHIGLLLRVSAGQGWDGRFYLDNIRFE